MNFQPELAAKVMAGEKTATRRLVSDNPRSPWYEGACKLKVDHTYAVCPGRAKHQLGRVRIVSVRREPLGWLAAGEELLEGFATTHAFQEAWKAINGAYDPKALVWRVEFAVVRPAAPRLQPADLPHVLRGLLSVGDAIGMAKAHGALRGDTEARLVAAGELAFEHLAPVLPAELMAIIADYVEECIAEHRGASAEVLVDPLRPQFEADARSQTGAEGVVQDDALALELPLDFGVARQRTGGDVDEAGLAAVLEVDAPPVAVGVGLGGVAGVFDPSDLHGGSVQATQAAKARGARRCERLQAVAQGRGQSDDGETS